jgi:hypothetical protein
VHVYSLTMLPDLPADNGILAQVPGQFTGAASMSLPPADSVAPVVRAEAGEASQTPALVLVGVQGGRDRCLIS